MAKSKSVIVLVVAVGTVVAGLCPIILHATDPCAPAPCERRFTWTIEKTADQNEVTLSIGQQLQVNYSVAVDASSYVTCWPPVDRIDECIDVCDTNPGSGFLGTVYAWDAPATLTYSILIGPYAECGDYRIDNVATLTTCDTQTTCSSCWAVTVCVPCEGGCTLTPGYWKTHSKYGPAPYDNTWALVDPNGEDSEFFDTGQSWYEVLWTEPKGGNAYYILGHAYIAAVLNELNGASVPAEVVTAMNDAEVLLDGYDGNPMSMDGLKGKNAKLVRAQFIAIAELLDDYNNGIIGPGHCTEE
ncbi:MAG: hypothetical protein ACYSTJ_00515 [Planctomycetota bacterium]|jgi:hypothetical protein